MKEKQSIKILKALSDETRFKIVEFLLDGEKCVCEIIPFTKRAQSTVSIQLGKMENWGLLESRRDGKKVFYRIRNGQVYDIFKALGFQKDRIIKKSCCMEGRE